MEESCSCDLNSIDNTESDGSPAIVKSHSETIDTPQSSEVISLDSRLSDKPETPTTAREIHTDTPTILEEGNSEAVSIPTTQETSEVISIESSSELYSEVHKIESPSPDSMVVQEALKKEEEPLDQKSQDAVPQSSPAKQPEESTQQGNVEQKEEEAEEQGEEEKEAEAETEEEAPKVDSNVPDTTASVAQEPQEDTETPSAESVEASQEKSSAVDNVASDDDVNPATVDTSEKTVTIEETSTETVPSMEQVDSENTPTTSPGETSPEPLNIKDIEKLQLENDRDIIDSDTSEAYLTPTENQENLGEMKSKDAEKMEEDVVEDIESAEKAIDKVENGENGENGENDTEEDSKNPNCSTSVIESTEACEEKVDVEDEKAEAVVTSELSSEECAVDSVTEEKSAVINGNDEKVTEKHSREPSTISTNVSDNKPDIPVRTDEVEVTDSVCSNSDIQSSVDNVTQVPNPKQQIPTISTVCDANKNMPDGVPQIVNSTVVTRDNSLLNDLTSDHVDTHRRSSLPVVSTETATDDSVNSNEPPSLPVPLRKTSSPQKRPRSASTSTQVDPNHFGKTPYTPFIF